MENLKIIVDEILSQDNRGTQDPVRCVLGKIKSYIDEDEDEDENAIEILSYHFTESQAKNFIKEFSYKYENMEVYVKSRGHNNGYSSTIRAMCEAVGKATPRHYTQ